MHALGGLDGRETCDVAFGNGSPQQGTCLFYRLGGIVHGNCCPSSMTKDEAINGQWEMDIDHHDRAILFIPSKKKDHLLVFSKKDHFGMGTCAKITGDTDTPNYCVLYRENSDQ